jgi:hypothetical protein
MTMAAPADAAKIDGLLMAVFLPGMCASHFLVPAPAVIPELAAE